MINIPESLIKSIAKLAKESSNVDFGYIELEESDVYEEIIKIALLDYMSIEPEVRELALMVAVVNLMTQITIKQLDQELLQDER